MKNIGIMGGTFNPIHMGHLIAAEEVRIEMMLDEIIFIPTGNPPHKNKSTILPAEHRLEMVKIAIGTNSNFQISDIEINRKGKTFTYDTLLELRRVYENCNLFFIIGYDTLKEIDTWKNIDAVCEMCSFIVVNRNNDYEEMNINIEKKTVKYNAKILVVDIPNIDISSTAIRNKRNSNKSIKYLVPESVEKHIYYNNLYTEVPSEGL